MIESPSAPEHQRSNVLPDSNVAILLRLFVVWVAADAFGIVWASLTAPLLETDGGNAGAGAIFVQNLGLWLGLGVGAIWLVAGPLKRLKSSSPTDIANALQFSGRPIDLAIGIGAGWALHWSVTGLYWVIDKLIGDVNISETAEALVRNSESVTGRIFLVVLVVVGAPLFEELFYRSAVLSALTPHFGPVASIVAGGIFFGVAHFQPDQIPGLALVGIVLGVLHWTTRRSLSNMAAHATFNLLTVLSLWKLGIPGVA